MIEFFNLREADVDLRAAGGTALAQQIGQAMQSLRTEHDIDIRRALDDGITFLRCNATTDADHEVRLVAF